jgi:hypothetical protein
MKAVVMEAPLKTLSEHESSFSAALRAPAHELKLETLVARDKQKMVRHTFLSSR